MKTTRIIALAAAIAGSLPAAPRYIGVATAAGSFWIDGTGVRNHATVFEGSTVETTRASVRLRLTGGARVLLESGSRARVYEDHLTIEKGRGQIESATNYRIEARSLRVALATVESQAVVTIDDGASVEVAALQGEVRVANGAGVVVANVESGHTVALHLQPEGGDAAVLTGCVSRASNAFVMRDEVSAVTFELRGSEVGRQVGKRVEVTGGMASVVAPAASVIQVTAIKVLGAGCRTTNAAGGKGSASRQAQVAPAPAAESAAAETPAATAPAATAPAAAPAAAAPAAATVAVATASVMHIAIIAGVVVAAVAGTVAGVVVAKQASAPVSPGR